MSKYVSIATQVMTDSNTNQVTFSSIPSSYRDLRLVFTGIITSTATTIIARLNTDSTTNYYTQQYRANASSNSASHTSANGIGGIAIATSGGAGFAIWDVFSYAQTGKSRAGMVYMQSNLTGSKELMLEGFRWLNTNTAVNSISVSVDNASRYFQSGSVFALYGIG